MACRQEERIRSRSWRLNSLAIVLAAYMKKWQNRTDRLLASSGSTVGPFTNAVCCRRGRRPEGCEGVLGESTGTCTVVKGVAASADVESSIAGSEIGEWLCSNWLLLFVVAAICNNNLWIFFNDSRINLSLQGGTHHICIPRAPGSKLYYRGRKRG